MGKLFLMFTTYYLTPILLFKEGMYTFLAVCTPSLLYVHQATIQNSAQSFHKRWKA